MLCSCGVWRFWLLGGMRGCGDGPPPSLIEVWVVEVEAVEHLECLEWTST
jgi:hypothetical protein